MDAATVRADLDRVRRWKEGPDASQGVPDDVNDALTYSIPAHCEALLAERDALAARVRELEAALSPLARVVPWLPDRTEDDVYLGTQRREGARGKG